MLKVASKATKISHKYNESEHNSNLVSGVILV